MVVKFFEVHPAIKLLLARMESNPEEFSEGSFWGTRLRLGESDFGLCSRYEKFLLKKALQNIKSNKRKMRMKQIHENYLKELTK